MKSVGLIFMAILAMFAGSHIYQSFEDYSNAQEIHTSTTDMLMGTIKPGGNTRGWPPKRGYYDDARRGRDSIAKTLVRDTPDHPIALCDETLKAKVTGRFNEYFDRKLANIRYPLRAVGESAARAAESDWRTFATEQADAKITAILKSGMIRVRDLRRGNFGEARRLLGAEDVPTVDCPQKPRV